MDDAEGAALPTAAMDESSHGGGGSPWRLRIVCALAVALIGVVGFLSWQRWNEGAPGLGDRGAATARATCGLVSVDHDGDVLYSEVGADGAAALEADWGDRQVPGRLHLDDRHRTDHREWTATGRFVAVDGAEVQVSGMYVEKFAIVTADCTPAEPSALIWRNP